MRINTPLISIIIPVYNGEKTISRAINSALNQTYKNIEVIVVDDKSTDNTLGVISNIKDRRLRVFKHKTNLFGSAARNTGLRNAKGEYIAFLDDDDESLPTRIEKQYDLLMLKSNRGYRAATTEHLIEEKSKWKHIKKKEEMYTIYNILSMKSGVGGIGSTLMIHRSILDDVGFFDESFRRHQDFEFAIRILKKTKISVVNEPLVKIYGHVGTPDPLKLVEIKRYFLNTFKEDIEKFSIKQQKEIYARHWLQVSRFFALDGDLKNTIKYLIKSFKYTVAHSDNSKFLIKETYFILPIYLIKSIIFGKRKWVQ